jgi:MinD-like ATPase involved in chromosome partitioning or flagellar assembly
MKILPIASGKGGVGKTTFALNLALTLSKKAPTILIDMDTGTSSIRHFLDMKIGKDLYHFLKKKNHIQECLTSISEDLDPDRIFKNFHLIASPKNFVYDIVNLDDPIKTKMIQGINSLKADYVILDIKAGLDTKVLNFLPFNNSGILLFTPKMKAATLAASEIAKATLFRTLRMVLYDISDSLPSDAPFTTEDLGLMREHLEKFMDDYDNEDKNFDDFLESIPDKFQNQQFKPRFKDFIQSYRVNFVLNKFNSVDESAEEIIKPFMANIFKSVSTKIVANNIGWVVSSDDIAKSTEIGIPYIITQHYKRKEPVEKEVTLDDKLREIMGEVKKAPEENTKPDIKEIISNQIDLLKTMYVNNAGKDPETNFDFIAERLIAIRQSSFHRCGMNHILTQEEIVSSFFY